MDSVVVKFSVRSSGIPSFASIVSSYHPSLAGGGDYSTCACYEGFSANRVDAMCVTVEAISA